ncbi:MAG TPA: IS3 family transposase [Dyella sp.]|nr:IS3 family transposase [Dyella sp.]HET6553706.1 IS3 family transposase [Dyella sp.]
MAKYDERFKLKVAREGARGTAGLREVARQYGLDYSMVRRWVDNYREHGAVGLAKKHSRYDALFKQRVLQRIRDEGLSRRQAMTLFGIRSPGVIAVWQRQYDRDGPDALTPACERRPSMPSKKPTIPKPDEELTREELLKELAYLRAETAYLKKLDALPGRASGDARQQAQAIQGLRHSHPLTLLLRAAELSRSTFYYQVQAMAAGDKQADLKARIRAVYDCHKGRYGYRRITAALSQTGDVINHKVVQRLMRKMDLKSRVRVKKYRSYRGEQGAVAPNELKRNFQAARPNQKWVTDVTEFKVDGQKLYLSPVMDLYNGEIVAYETSARPVFDMVRSMLGKAFARLGPSDAPLLHSDQGWQYQQPAYRRLLAGRNLTQSMSRKGNCLDNAAMESFFGTLKAEFFHLDRFDSIEQLKRGIDRYIRYYNHHRIKLKLKGLSPVQYRTQAFDP